MSLHIKATACLSCVLLVLMVLTTACSTVTSTSGALVVTGNYKFIAGDTIRVDLSGPLGLLGSQVFKVSINGDELTLSGGGTSAKYKRPRGGSSVSVLP